jgi:large subunit ribosomal protein L30
MGQLRITLRRSVIGHPQDQKDTAKALGLTRPRRTVVRPDTAPIRGMIDKIHHLVTVERIDESEGQRGS